MFYVVCFMMVKGNLVINLVFIKKTEISVYLKFNKKDQKKNFENYFFNQNF